MKRTISYILIVVMAISLAACVRNGDVHETTPTVSGELSTTPEPQETTTNVTTRNTLTLRIGSYNIANGREVDHDMKLIAEDVLKKELDIVGFQEVDRHASRSKFIDTMALLSEYTGYKYYHYTKALNIAGNPEKYGHNGEYGTGILSKYPILETDSILLESGTHEQRAYGYAKIDVNGTIVNFFNTHLSYEDYTVRSNQFKILADMLKDMPNCILTGDFNVSGMTEYKALSFMTPAATVDGSPITFPKSGKTIDNIIFTNNFKLKNVGSLKNDHSDHYLMYTVLEIDLEN